MNKPILAVDIDDVLFPFSHEFVKYANSKLGVNKTVDDMVTYRLDRVYGVSYQEIVDLIKGFMEEPSIVNLPPLVGAKETLQKLSKYFDLHIITARLDCYDTQTQAWLNLHLPGIFTAVHYCGFYALCPNKSDRVTKLMKCNEIGAIGLIDDNGENIENVLSGNLIGILFGEYAWHNEVSPDIKPIRIKDWKALGGCYNMFLPDFSRNFQNKQHIFLFSHPKDCLRNLQF